MELVTALTGFTLTCCTLAMGIFALYGVIALADVGIVDKNSLTSFLSLAAPLLTMVQFVSPFPLMAEAIRKMNVQNVPTQVFKSQAACNILGLSYGIQIANVSVLATNMFGLACQILLLAGDHFVRASNTKWIWFSITLSVMFNISLYACVAAPIDILGHMITLFNIVLFASPLTKLGVILKTQNASALPGAMTVIQCANNAIWILYALMLQDMVVLFPSVLGYLLSGFQVLVILWCQHKLPFDLGWLLLVFAPICRGSSAKACTSPRAQGIPEKCEDGTTTPVEMMKM
eukprot:gnl/TRDRNA2_/TRDRNA2_186745_c0_seq1.p1 gnl/TRDRNA2_/TRDRNA2_186745_c0~~gnl/TRDRNA2_/TRDRNA2_186745_c0_seq1.p1  ORF type:complete len:289 (-),score=55.27 gnl/TRDRNA2_/TRDRNA2_186745_c0_seq1:188-1054(-)